MTRDESMDDPLGPVAEQLRVTVGDRARPLPVRVGYGTGQAMVDDVLDPVAAVEAAIAAADRWEPRVQSLTTRLDERARGQARAAQAELAAGSSRGPLHGVPIVVKDLIDVAGVLTTAGSALLRDNVATSDAVAVARLRRAGAIVFAKANTHEFGNGALTPPTTNPWGVEHLPGGSSGGTAAAIGAGIVSLGLGTDSAGSVREPAALCGVVGLKPTTGLVPSAGSYQLTTTMSTIGPMARTVQGCAQLLDVLTGGDGYAGPPADQGRLRGLRVGVAAELAVPIRADVAALLGGLQGALDGSGAVLTELSGFDLEAANAAAFLTLGAESLSLHQAWLDERGAEYTPGVRAFLDMAHHYSARDYVDAQRLRAVLTATVDGWLDEVDVVLAPAQLTTAPRFTADSVSFPDGSSLPRDFTLVRPLLPFSFTGHPAVSVPGWLSGGLPVGFQLVARIGKDRRLLRTAGDVQTLTDWRADGLVATF
jgi:aspartyl-tRNA(Asn)/glutamyl-tRNA(Gln) amidotransferase subunit A